MNASQRARVSKFLSFVLRHQPQAIGITLDKAGWVDVETLLRQWALHKPALSQSALEYVVNTSPKKRFAFNQERTRIRANQGHSLPVDLGYPPAPPPEFLYHGTVARFVPAIQRSGLLKMQRHHVHLSIDKETAHNVGSRRGKAILLRVHAQQMNKQGHLFALSQNQVWLTEMVPPEFIDFPPDRHS